MVVSATTRGVATLAALSVVFLFAASSAHALTTLGGSPVPNTGPGADAEAGFGQVAGAPNVLGDELLDAPFDGGDTDPAEAAATAALWSPGTPENDLAA